MISVCHVIRLFACANPWLDESCISSPARSVRVVLTERRVRHRVQDPVLRSRQRFRSALRPCRSPAANAVESWSMKRRCLTIDLRALLVSLKDALGSSPLAIHRVFGSPFNSGSFRAGVSLWSQLNQAEALTTKAITITAIATVHPNSGRER